MAMLFMKVLPGAQSACAFCKKQAGGHALLFDEAPAAGPKDERTPVGEVYFHEDGVNCERLTNAFINKLKAAAIDVVAEAALARGAEVVLAANDVVPVEEVPLDERLLEMAKFGS